MSDVPRERVVVPDDKDEWTADRIPGLKCVTRPDGRKSHIFLDNSNRCECNDVDLNAYRGDGVE